MNFIGLPHWEVASVKETAHDFAVEATFSVVPERCPNCPVDLVSGKLYRHGTTTQEVMDMPTRGKRVRINLKRVRLRCQDCKKTFVQDIPDLNDAGTMMRRLAEWIERRSLTHTFSSVAEEVGVAEGTVRNVFARHVEYLEENTDFLTPERLGIDEIHLIRKPRCVFTNIKEKTIVGVLPDRLKKSVVRHLKTMDTDAVKVVCIDMTRAYRDAAREVFPNAAVVVDKFHVVRMANQCLEDVRKSFRASLEPKERRKLMHDRFVLLKRNRDLKPEQKATLESWEARFPKIGVAYRLKERFFGLWDAPDKKTAAELFGGWREDITDPEMVTAFQPLLTAWKNWEPEILAYFDHGDTNAVTESLNNITRHISRNGRGYSFEVIRAKMLWGRPQKRPPYTGAAEQRKKPRPYRELTGVTLGADVESLLRELEAENPNPTPDADSSEGEE